MFTSGGIPQSGFVFLHEIKKLKKKHNDISSILTDEGRYLVHRMWIGTNFNKFANHFNMSFLTSHAQGSVAVLHFHKGVLGAKNKNKRT
jgi:hypothetical protein